MLWRCIENSNSPAGANPMLTGVVTYRAALRGTIDSGECGWWGRVTDSARYTTRVDKRGSEAISPTLGPLGSELHRKHDPGTK